MHMKMRNRDYVADGAGGFLQAEGTGLLLEQALFLLSARRGGFSLLPELGSRLYLLPSEKPSARAAVARTYAQEALEPLGLTVNDVSIVQGEALEVAIKVSGQGEDSILEVIIQ